MSFLSALQGDELAILEQYLSPVHFPRNHRVGPPAWESFPLVVPPSAAVYTINIRGARYAEGKDRAYSTSPSR